LVRVWPLSFFTKTYYRLRWTPTIRRWLNRHANAAFQQEPPKLDATQERCVDQLRSQGISLTTLGELTRDDNLYSGLMREAEQRLSAPLVARQIANRRADRTPKWYVIRALGYGFGATLPPGVAAVCLHPTILAVANAYLGTYCRLCYANLWYNVPTEPHEPAIDSERWHRDHEDRNIVKLYVYLCDVDEQMGPLSYLRGSQPGGKHEDVFPVNPPEGSYPAPERLSEKISADAVVSCTGQSGTVILCDTAGFHRGGRSSTKARILLTATYVSDSALERRRYDLEDSAQRVELGPAARFALWRT
jgi:hypothetical protein